MVKKIIALAIVVGVVGGVLVGCGSKTDDTTAPAATAGATAGAPAATAGAPAATAGATAGTTTGEFRQRTEIVERRPSGRLSRFKS
jgi:hypothetical protein